jgi:hypothetical protein
LRVTVIETVALFVFQQRSSFHEILMVAPPIASPPTLTGTRHHRTTTWDTQRCGQRRRPA